MQVSLKDCKFNDCGIGLMAEGPIDLVAKRTKMKRVEIGYLLRDRENSDGKDRVTKAKLRTRLIDFSMATLSNLAASVAMLFLGPGGPPKA